MPKKIIKKQTKSSTASTVKRTRRSKKELATVTGMRDILPQDQKYWEAVRKSAQKIAVDYGYGRIDMPVLEQTEVFVRGVGKQTDIVEKEMFSFEDQGENKLSLRPEATASAVRAYIQHGMLNQPQPVKFFYIGPMFRHEKPQSGRYRQFFQFGFEAIGEINPALDAQLILMGWNSLNELGLESIIQVNSIGCSGCREEYKKALVKYYKGKTKLLCESCKNRIVKNPLRLLDCKEEACHNLRDEAPQILDYLDDDCKTHFMKVVDYLDELDLPYVLNPYIVRGLDYYTKTIFEYWSPGDEGGKNAFGGGGRYDELVMLMGGREDTPACGLAMGMDRLVAKLRENEIEISQENRPDVFIAQLGEAAKRKTFTLYEKLRKSDLKMAQAFYKDSLKNQLEMANKLKVKITLILGQKEISDGTILIRDMQGGVQEVIDMNKIELEIKKRLEKYENGVPALNLNEEEEAPTSVGNEVGIPTESVGKEPKINNEEKKLDKK